MTGHDEIYRNGAARAREGLAETLGDWLPDADAARALARRIQASKAYAPYKAGGEIWVSTLARRGGREYQGGAVCWNPDQACEGICRSCPRENGQP